MRTKNKEDMTLHEQLEDIATKICSHYCKYPDIWDEEKEGCELQDSEICKNCPLSEL